MTTKIPQGVFQFEFIPFFENPKDLLVLKCIDKESQNIFPKRADAILKHFEPEFYQFALTHVTESNIQQLKDDLIAKVAEIEKIKPYAHAIIQKVTEAQVQANEEEEHMKPLRPICEEL